MSQVRVVRTEGVVEVWVPRGTDEAAVQSAVDVYARKGYRTIVYRSGTVDIVEATTELLRANL